MAEEKKKESVSVFARIKQIKERKKKQQEQLDEIFEEGTPRHSQRNG